MAVDSSSTFVVETDASGYAIAATLSQGGRPVAFFSRTLTQTEQRHSSVEKEAYAIVEALRCWRHFLIGKHFQLITDQKSVAFMFDVKHRSKVKNEKIARWRVELSCYCFEILYRPGSENVVADAFSRVCGVVSLDKLQLLHDGLCHPGVTRMIHFVRSKNLPFSVEDVRKVTSGCSVCAEVKPRFCRKKEGHLIKSTAPFERLNIDFKGPLPSSSNNRYLLVIVDEYSRFPFAFPCSDLSATTVVRCLSELFTVFGVPAYVHSDRGTSFMSSEVKSFLLERGVATSRTTPYNPQGNGQVERYNAIIWRVVPL